MKKKNECGALIVEATIVFPVMFLVIFFMIFAGNAYLQKCRVEAIINEYAIDGASYCADPQLQSAASNKIPKVEDLEVYPYRYFSSSQSGYSADVAAQVEEDIYKRVTQMSTGLFSGMKPIIKKSDISATYASSFVYATFKVDATYKIEIPVRLLGESENMHLAISTHVEMPVSDSVELIRNVDMVWDYMERFGIAEEINKFKAKLSESLDKVNQWFEG